MNDKEITNKCEICGNTCGGPEGSNEVLFAISKYVADEQNEIMLTYTRKKADRIYTKPGIYRAQLHPQGGICFKPKDLIHECDIEAIRLWGIICPDCANKIIPEFKMQISNTT